MTAQQLGELHQFFTTLLAETSPDKSERRIILATLENIERVMAAAAKPKPRGFAMQP